MANNWRKQQRIYLIMATMSAVGLFIEGFDISTSIILGFIIATFFEWLMRPPT